MAAYKFKETWRAALAGSGAWEKFALFAVAFATFQAVLRIPEPFVSPANGVNISPVLVGFVSLVTSLALAWRSGLRPRSTMAITSLALAGLAILSSAFSPLPYEAFMRALALVVPSLAGFWASQLLLRTPSRQTLFLWLCTALITIFLGSCIVGYLGYGDVHFLFDEARHPQVNTGMLLLFVPVTLIMSRRFPAHSGGLILAVVALGVFFFSGLRTAVLMPVIVGVVALVLGHCSWKQFTLILACLSLFILGFFTLFPEKRLEISREPAYYRLENYPFSLHIIKKHPLFGIGLHTPRLSFLKDYETHYPFATKEQFAWTLKRVIVSENVFLTVPVGLGIPFTLFFVFFMFANFKRWIGYVRRPPAAAAIPPIAIFLGLVAALLHFMIYDGLLYPNVAWIFNLLLGIVPVAAAPVTTDNEKTAHS